MNRNSNKDETYQPWRAASLYLYRRKFSIRIPRVNDEKLRNFITKCFDNFLSPEIITAIWKGENGGKLSYNTMYRAIHKKLFPKKYSPKTHLRRRGKRKNAHNSQSIKPDYKICDRAPIVEKRQKLGDLEGDTVYGGVGKGCVVTLVDRTSRFLYGALAKSRKKCHQKCFRRGTFRHFTRDSKHHA